MKPPADNNKEGAESHKLESESKPIWKSMSMFLVPLLLSNVLQSVGQLFGMVVVGRWLGVNDLAVYQILPIIFLARFICNWYRFRKLYFNWSGVWC